MGYSGGKGKEFGVADEGVVLFEVEQVLFKLGGGFGGVEVLDVREGDVRNGMVEKANRVAREQAAVRGEGDEGGDEPKGFPEQAGWKGWYRQAIHQEFGYFPLKRRYSATRVLSSKACSNWRSQFSMYASSRWFPCRFIIPSTSRRSRGRTETSL